MLSRWRSTYSWAEFSRGWNCYWKCEKI